MKVKDLDFTLYNGIKIPAVGFETWQVKDPSLPPIFATLISINY